MLLSTPPSNTHKSSKYILAHSTTNQAKQGRENDPFLHNEETKQVKEELRHTSMFAQHGHSLSSNMVQNTRHSLLLQTPPYQSGIQNANCFHMASPMPVGLYNNSCESQKHHQIKCPKATHPYHAQSTSNQLAKLLQSSP